MLYFSNYLILYIIKIMNVNQISQENKNTYENVKLFYIDEKVNHKKFLIVKINYEHFVTLTYEDIQKNIDIFYQTYVQNKYTKKIIIIIDIQSVKKLLNNSNMIINSFNIVNNIHLINLIHYINDTYNDYILKCILIRYTNIDKQLMLLCKQIFKSNNFMNKVEAYSQNS